MSDQTFHCVFRDTYRISPSIYNFQRGIDMKYSAFTIITMISLLFLFCCCGTPAVSTTENQAKVSESSTHVIHQDTIKNCSETLSASETENTFVIVLMEEWNRFPLLNKYATFYKVDQEAKKDNDLLFHEDETGLWQVWCFDGDDWTIAEILQVYGIHSANDLKEIVVTYKNANKFFSEQIITESSVISDVYDILYGISHVISIYTWGESFNNYVLDEYDIYTHLSITVVTEFDDRLEIRFEPGRNCLIQGGETVYVIDDINKHSLFKLLTGMEIHEFKEEYMIRKQKGT